jgi:transcription elongation factor Elf1
VGRRKKRKVQVRKRIKRIPKIFICPYCSKQSLQINIRRVQGEDYAIAEAICGECGFCARFRVPTIMQPVDAYGRLIDLYDSYEGDVDELVREKRCLTDGNIESREME